MANIKGYLIAQENNFFSPNIKYAVAFLADKMLFIKMDKSLFAEILSTNRQMQMFILGSVFALLCGVTGLLVWNTPEAGLFGLIIGVLVGVFIGIIVSGSIRKKVKITRDIILQRLADLPPEELLRLNKKNFEVWYNAITGADFMPVGFNLACGNSRVGILRLYLEGCKSDKYDISDEMSYGESLELLRKMLPCKVSKWEYVGIPKLPLAVDVIKKREKRMPENEIFDYICKKGITEADAADLLVEASTNGDGIRQLVKEANKTVVFMIMGCFAVLFVVYIWTLF
ncbi:hypothetical protein DA01_00475 [Dehalococcoides mccartyi]|uniref:Uncharacterized protein n=1 Tax=Dehalococcoides mccartyi TaxID=61435 RepID=A0A0V8M626_9CHLR|nr:hypothetical protein [Dehalococcoides mccartyi]KSV18977.1 hypothetical protein DA01_00475 [Dehalococcoides mccartyi]